MNRPSKYKRCLACERPKSGDAYFCSTRCGEVWAVDYLSSGDVAWCETCGHGYVDQPPPPTCEHCGGPSGTPEPAEEGKDE